MSAPWFAKAPPLPRSSRIVSDEVYEALLAAILRTEIPPAARINIEAVAQTLHVSATPVREALARLESDGLVDKVHLKGYRTTGLLTKHELAELWDFRLLIEPFSAGRAASRRGEGDASRKAALIDEVESFTAAPAGQDFDSYREFSAHDARLHGMILDLSANDVITRSFERTHCHLHSFRLGYNRFAGRETVDEHSQIVRAIAAGDGTGAEKAMRTHLEHSRDRLLRVAKDE